MYPLLQGWLDFTAGIIKFSSNLIQMDWPSESRRKVEYFIDFYCLMLLGCDGKEREAAWKMALYLMDEEF